LGYMENHQHRFYCHIEADGSWGVWDCVRNKPATLGGGDLIGCTAQRAEAAEQVLTSIYSGGLDALAVRIAGIVSQRGRTHQRCIWNEKPTTTEAVTGS
jgi:hypothetical protein